MPDVIRISSVGMIGSYRKYAHAVTNPLRSPSPCDT
jgi:hypothetical protein